MQLIAQETSGNHHIEVYETSQLYGELGRFRFLQFSDGAVQGAVDLKNPKRILLEYPRAIIHLMERNVPSFENVFMIGHGIGTIAGHYPAKSFKTAEIDAMVVELSRRYFGFNGNDVVIGDGRLILSKENDRSFDCMILDAFMSEGTPQHLMTYEFFRMTREKLLPHGCILLNVTGKAQGDKRINAVHTTLNEIYPFVEAFALPSEHAADIRNIIVMGSGTPIEYEIGDMAGFIRHALEPGYVIKDKKSFA